jgi:hypothetical protein
MRENTKYDAAILAALTGRDLDLYGVIDAVGECTRSGIVYALRALHAARAIHVVKHQRASGGTRPVWSIGPGRDAKRPAPLSGAKRSKRYRDKLRDDDPVEYHVRKERYNLRHRGHKVQPDIAAAWMMNS